MRSVELDTTLVQWKNRYAVSLDNGPQNAYWGTKKIYGVCVYFWQMLVNGWTSKQYFHWSRRFNWSRLWTSEYFLYLFYCIYMFSNFKKIIEHNKICRTIYADILNIFSSSWALVHRVNDTAAITSMILWMAVKALLTGQEMPSTPRERNSKRVIFFFEA